MVKDGAGPGRRRVAIGTGSRETGGHVVGIRDGLILGLVTGVTISRRSREHSVDVALRALDGCVRSGEWELRRVVVERSRCPGRRVVTHFALLRETRGRVIGVGGRVVVRQVTTDARRGKSDELVVLVTQRALQRTVGSSKRELRRRVIE